MKYAIKKKFTIFAYAFFMIFGHLDQVSKKWSKNVDFFY